MNWLVEPLGPRHNRDSFCCGHTQLDDYIRKQAGQHTRKRVGRTYVAVLSGTADVLGYYTLTASSVAFMDAPAKVQKKLPRYPLPAALLAKLAVDRSSQGLGLGEFLLIDALRRVWEISDQIAIFAVEVHAVDSSAAEFYRRYGFQPLLDQPAHLFLPLDTIRSLFGPNDAR